MRIMLMIRTTHTRITICTAQRVRISTRRLVPPSRNTKTTGHTMNGMHFHTTGVYRTYNGDPGAGLRMASKAASVAQPVTSVSKVEERQAQEGVAKLRACANGVRIWTSNSDGGPKTNPIIPKINSDEDM